MNSLTVPFNTRHDSAPFSSIATPDFKPLIEAALEEARAEIAAIRNHTAAPDFSNTIETLEFSGQKLDRITSIFFNLNSAETNDEMQQIAQEVSPLLTAFSNDISLDETLFARVRAVYEQRANLALNAEQSMLLEKKFKSFARNGALLPEEKKQQLRTIDTELAKLKLTYGENVLAETHDYILHITKREDLAGLPEGAIEAAAAEATARQLEGWVFTLDFPSYLPFVTYAENRDLRKELTLAAGRKAFRGNAHDNRDNVKRIATLRHERAVLLGYESHAHFVLEERMAQTPAAVKAFLNDLLEKAKPAAQREFAELEAFAKSKDGLDRLEKWDGPFYAEKLKQQRFNLDDEVLKPYFQLEDVVDGAFTVAGRLFGIRFEEVFDVDTYHEEVRTFEVRDADDSFLALFYADFFPRKGKRNGAWMTSFKPQFRKEGREERPHVSIVCNFTRPTDTKPSLLTFNEVTTLFHEFGHALHGMLANTTYPSLSGTSVYWDFVELPSQVMENWCYEPEALALFARHYETAEVIPQEYVDRIRESAAFLEGMATLRQLSFGLLDMAYHSADPSGITDVKAFEKQAFESTALYPDVEENCMSVAFSHIFQGGYSSGYYSYKWAEVLDADAFAYFQETGIFNTETAAKFREHVLSKGGTEHPMTLYKRFRGQEPKPDALLRRAGLVD
ncbi:MULTISPECIES: M3 family metallopeptidase [unclassified Flavobacterium]|uniref:M3 family metallopeptidase n=1 Tax=unclassified Flavobacterium TaxID=196869 RepID=UPI001F143970|nr:MULTISPECIES: M3 family metallopeptidase [unclassified Flavobacterium]UMY67066.1 M3 family metallopeptidase [Flavobacterium sp. HJ-32-4]